MSSPLTSTVTCIYPLSGLTVICLNAFQPLTCSNTPLRMRRKKRISEVNGVKTVCFLLHQKKAWKRLSCSSLTVDIFTTLWFMGRFEVVECRNISWYLSKPGPFLYLSAAAFNSSLKNKNKSPAPPPQRFKQLQYQQKGLK